MLSKKYRLPIQKFLTRSSETRRSDYFSLKSFKPDQPYSRFGVVIGKRVHKSAVARNRLKRLMFRFFQENKNRISDRDFLVIVAPSAGRLVDYSQVALELGKLFKL